MADQAGSAAAADVEGGTYRGTSDAESDNMAGSAAVWKATAAVTSLAAA
eukprot:CAMPEP_0206323532 /NCGR_PEP_ID=MMETSP0106_2-20121207/20031_1 /ASSEMBLY_ACC=CAM_ASM_000206 /TAXON_ID=81532 /ORGANISM="Acanthoeca-like sp., Strain 10tr" /LENGTH=48 /DNA_ID= /DNA_START= /DNA_END= /DNA_ORIENTATION=